MTRNFIFISFIFLATACAKKTLPSGSKSSGDLMNYSEDISALLPSYEEAKEDKKESKEEVIPSTVEIKDDGDKVKAAQSKILEYNKTYNNGQGYRIQIFSGNSRSDFENAKSYMLRNFPNLEIYETYSQPTYRIRVGDFIHYQDAEKYSANLRQRFGTTRIISEKINIKKALNTK
jgi:hypothetical protein